VTETPTTPRIEELKTAAQQLEAQGRAVDQLIAQREAAIAADFEAIAAGSAPNGESELIALTVRRRGIAAAHAAAQQAVKEAEAALAARLRGEQLAQLRALIDGDMAKAKVVEGLLDQLVVALEDHMASRTLVVGQFFANFGRNPAGRGGFISSGITDSKATDHFQRMAMSHLQWRTMWWRHDMTPEAFRGYSTGFNASNAGVLGLLDEEEMIDAGDVALPAGFA
jgi:hypothetical protein